METQVSSILGKKVTVRKGSNKAHPAFVNDRGSLLIACSCPGAQNGSSRHGMAIICDGWDKVTCKN
jgi:hypothetical protein